MLVGFLFALRQAGVPASLTEFLGLLAALEQRLAFLSVEQFYYLARLALVKDERHFDRYDRVFAEHFAGAERRFAALLAELPADWLRSLGERLLSAEEMQQVKALGGWEELMRTLRERLAEQRGRHEGGSKWIGTRGTSPFGADGYNPEGVRIGQQRSRHRRAVKVWDQREFRNLDDSLQLGVRNLQMALRRLRRFAREGAPEVLDLDDTIHSTARNAGWLDLKMVPERRNAIKVLLLLDSGGSMDDHIRLCDELFSAARAEFKRLEHFYFHNFIYDFLWKDNQRRLLERTSTLHFLRTYNSDYRVVIVGDAYMSPYEIKYAGGGVEHFNEESGAVWMRRLCAHFPYLVWLNPLAEHRWPLGPSIEMVRELVDGRMFPLTPAGLTNAMRTLRQRQVPQHSSRLGSAPSASDESMIET